MPYPVLRPLQPRPQQGPPSSAASLHQYKVLKKPRKSRGNNNKRTARKLAPSNAQDAPHETDSDGESGSIVASNDGIGWKDGSMQWWDDEELKWSMLLSYVTILGQVLILKQSQRAIIINAEPSFCIWRHNNLVLPVSCVTYSIKQWLMEAVWTPDMGLDKTSFSDLTRGWTKDPRSVRDAQGRRVFLMKQRPADWNVKAEYDLLTLNGCILLDSQNNPVLDVPGLPHTLATDIEDWFITGLRRSLKIEMKE